jgi:hypothetical protein
MLHCETNANSSDMATDHHRMCSGYVSDAIADSAAFETSIIGRGPTEGAKPIEAMLLTLRQRA